MWIYARDGFLSIVQDRNDPSKLMVRGRFKGDIEHYFPKAEVIHTPDGDYLYRTSLPREIVAVVLSREVTKIDYDRYKPAVSDPRREGTYLMCFLEMENLQELLAQA